MKTLFAESTFWEQEAEFTEQYTKVISDAYADAKKQLPEIPDDVTFVAQTNAWECIPETGDGGYTRSSRLVLLSLDPDLPHGKQKLLENTRFTVFHELNHTARYGLGIWHKTFLDSCIMEGLATVFERECGGAKPLWGKYEPAEAKKWLEEIKGYDPGSLWGEYMFTHSDGRRWVGYKVGTYLIDQAMEQSGKSIQELTVMECKDILKITLKH